MLVKDLNKKIKVSMAVFLGLFFLPLCFLTNHVTTNMNLSFLSFIHQGDKNSLFGLRQVSSPDYITVKDHEFVGDTLVIDYLSSNLLSPIDGLVVRRGIDRGNRFLVIQSNNHEYKISGLESFNVFVFQNVRVSDVLGQIINDNGVYRVMVQNLTNNSFLEVVMLINEYEEI